MSAELRVRVCAHACVHSRKAGRRREWRSVVVKEKKSQTKRECSVLGSEEDRIRAGRADSCLIDQKVILKELETLIQPSDWPSFHTIFQQKCSEFIARHQDHQTSGQFENTRLVLRQPGHFYSALKSSCATCLAMSFVNCGVTSHE